MNIPPASSALPLSSRGDGTAGPPAQFALLSAALLVLVHGAVLAVAPRGLPLPLARVAASLLATASPYALLAAALHRRADDMAVGAARTLATLAGRVLPVVLIGSVLVVVGRLVFLLSPLLSMLGFVLVLPAQWLLSTLGVAGFALLAVFAGVQRRLADSLRALPTVPDGGRRARRGSGLAVAYVLILISFAISMHRSGEAATLAHGRDAERRIRAQPVAARLAMMAVQRCVVAHAARSATGYPSTLAELGRGGDGCLADSLASGRISDWRIVYTPGPRDSVQAIATYRIELVAAGGASAAEGRLVTDETGGTHAAPAAADSGAPPPVREVDSPVPRMREFALCILKQQVDYHLAGLPAEIGHKAPNGSWGCLGPNAGPTSPRSQIEEHIGPVADYVITYVPGERDARGRIISFTMTARPRRYGETGIRSYLLDEAGRIHYTTQDRAATANDKGVGG